MKMNMKMKMIMKMKMNMKMERNMDMKTDMDMDADINMDTNTSLIISMEFFKRYTRFKLTSEACARLSTKSEHHSASLYRTAALR
jgi:hypothetical protein